MLFRQIEVRNGIEIRWRSDRTGVLRGAISTISDNGLEYSFFVANDADTVQREALSGQFYERKELACIEQHFAGGVFVDIGTNVGNHTIFAAKALGAKVICFEPNQEALQILDINLRLNECRGQVTVHAVGLSDEPGFAAIEGGYRNNLGSARLKASDSSEGFPIKVGDDMLLEEHVGFIKIDTEGYEIEVLGGLKSVIKRCKPILFVEVDKKNFIKFEKFIEDMNYYVCENYSNYDDNVNFICKNIS